MEFKILRNFVILIFITFYLFKFNCYRNFINILIFTKILNDTNYYLNFHADDNDDESDLRDSRFGYQVTS